MDKISEFKEEVNKNIEKLGEDEEFKEITSNWMQRSFDLKYSYNFSWMGRPIIQYPQDIIQMQELIWRIRPDLIIETGIAHGGSIVFYASMMELLGTGHVLGIDLDIREHNRNEIEKHSMFTRITMFEGSSIDPVIVKRVKEFAKGYNKILLVLDSCHTKKHVFDELQIYSELVGKGSYIVVFDTLVEFLKSESSNDRPWGKEDNPYSAVQEFIENNKRFRVNGNIDSKLGITVAPGGYLECIEDYND